MNPSYFVASFKRVMLVYLHCHLLHVDLSMGEESCLFYYEDAFLHDILTHHLRVLQKCRHVNAYIVLSKDFDNDTCKCIKDNLHNLYKSERSISLQCRTTSRIGEMDPFLHLQSYLSGILTNTTLHAVLKVLLKYYFNTSKVLVVVLQYTYLDLWLQLLAQLFPCLQFNLVYCRS